MTSLTEQKYSYSELNSKTSSGEFLEKIMKFKDEKKIEDVFFNFFLLYNFSLNLLKDKRFHHTSVNFSYSEIIMSTNQDENQIVDTNKLLSRDYTFKDKIIPEITVLVSLTNEPSKKINFIDYVRENNLEMDNLSFSYNGKDYSLNTYTEFLNFIKDNFIEVKSFIDIFKPYYSLSEEIYNGDNTISTYLNVNTSNFEKFNSEAEITDELNIKLKEKTLNKLTETFSDLFKYKFNVIDLSTKMNKKDIQKEKIKTKKI